MFALLNVDTDQYISRIAPPNHGEWAEWWVSFSGDESSALRWEKENNAKDVLEWLRAIGSIPDDVDVRVVEVEDVW